jgi:hypothetical protein
MRLSQREQILLQKAAHDNPGSLADWLLGWVEAQQKVGVNGSFDIHEIPIPVDLDCIEMGPAKPIRMSQPPSHPIDPRSGRPVQAAPNPQDLVKARLEAREQWRQILEEVGYSGLPKWQRKAINKFRQAHIGVAEETDRQPDTETCWMGDHDMEGWDAEDFYLWVVSGTWTSGQTIRKWGCKECALIIAKTHPEAVVNDIAWGG